jgi:hypothetical protein
MSVAHAETDNALDLETFALEQRPKTYAETMRALVQEQAGPAASGGTYRVFFGEMIKQGCISVLGRRSPIDAVDD